MDFKAIADKVIPTLVTAAIMGLLLTYFKVEFLEYMAGDLFNRAEKKHHEQDSRIVKLEDRIMQCEKDDIILQKDVEYLRYAK